MSRSSELAGAKILVVSRSTTAHGNSGGMETSADALVRALHQLGATTALLTTETGAGPLPPGFRGHALVWEIPTGRPGRYSRRWWSRTRADGPWQSWKPDIVLGIGDAAASFTRDSPTKRPVVVHSHGTTFMETKSALATRRPSGLARAALNVVRTPTRTRHLRRASIVVAAGPAIEDNLQRWPYLVGSRRLRLLANSIDVERFGFDPAHRSAVRDDWGVGPETVVWIFVGRLDADKGVESAIQALSLPAAKDVHLVIVGEGRIRRELEHQVAGLNLSSRVRFEGRLPPDRIGTLMSGADVFVFPTRRIEGLPMSALEAAANGLPLLTTPKANLPSDLRASHLVHCLDGTSATLASAVPIRREVRTSYLPDAYSAETLASRLGEVLQSADLWTSS